MEIGDVFFYCSYFNVVTENVDERALQELENLISKVDEMKNQRAMLWSQLRDSIHKDDITGVLITKQPHQSLDDIFQKELEKHQPLVSN